MFSLEICHFTGWLHPADEKRGNCFIFKVQIVSLSKRGFIAFLLSLAHPVLLESYSTLKASQFALPLGNRTERGQVERP